MFCYRFSDCLGVAAYEKRASIRRDPLEVIGNLIDRTVRQPV